jgi:carbonic anhydrase/acetyltransferase-like protein (isoleucine patch superfamily)
MGFLIKTKKAACLRSGLPGESMRAGVQALLLDVGRTTTIIIEAHMIEVRDSMEGFLWDGVWWAMEMGRKVGSGRQEAGSRKQEAGSRKQEAMPLWLWQWLRQKTKALMPIGTLLPTRSASCFRPSVPTYPLPEMPIILPINGIHPQIPAFLAPNATLIGDVRFGRQCSVWFGSVLRGDINHVMLGDRCNVQDNCVLHVSKKLPCVLGDDVSLGHGVIAHACTVRNGALLGMGCRILDGAVIGEGALVAAGCVVGEHTDVPAHHLVAGVPGKIIKPLSVELRERVAAVAGNYVAYQELYPEICRLAESGS